MGLKPKMTSFWKVVYPLSLFKKMKKGKKAKNQDKIMFLPSVPRQPFQTYSTG
jgi:hypothetical protein